MTDPAVTPVEQIQVLLAERARFEEWLARLDAVGGSTPEAVRARVRGDYQRRLDGVIDTLRGHAAVIGAELLRLRERHAGLRTAEGAKVEELAEGALRYAVGEYDDATWSALRDEAEADLARLRGTLGELDAEIGTLVEVEDLIQRPHPAPPPPPAPVPAPVAAAPEPVAEPIVVPPEPTPVSPEAAPVPPEPLLVEPIEPEPLLGGPPAAEVEPSPGLGDLAVIEPPFEPAPAASGPRFVPSAGAAASPPVAPPELQPAPEADVPPPGERGLFDDLLGAGALDTGGGPPPRTVRCPECGFMNRDGSWYCDSCGSELPLA